MVKDDVVSIDKSIGKKGEYVRKESAFRNFVKNDPQARFPAVANRYHLYVGAACPWSHRVMAAVALKGLTKVISTTWVHFLMESKGWKFVTKEGELEGCSPDPQGKAYLSEHYHEKNPDYEGNITVPVLYDTQEKVIVNNESSEILRMLNTEFNHLCETEEQRKLDMYPSDLRNTIDETNEWVYKYINNGVYRSGFAKSQDAYEEAVKGVFEHLDKAEAILSKQRYIAGDRFTEADLRLFVTLIRFDPVYVGHFKCNLKRISDYPNLFEYTKEIYQMKGVKETTNFYHIKNHYYQSHRGINPTGVVPLGPIVDFDAPFKRP